MSRMATHFRGLFLFPHDGRIVAQPCSRRWGSREIGQRRPLCRNANDDLLLDDHLPIRRRGRFKLWCDSDERRGLRHEKFRIGARRREQQGSCRQHARNTALFAPIPIKLLTLGSQCRLDEKILIVHRPL
jgi:hypothetical protein